MINFTVFIIFSETGPAKDPRLKLVISFHSQRTVKCSQRLCLWIWHSLPQQPKIIPLLHLCGTFSLSFWLIAKSLCSDSLIHNYLPVWEEWRLGREWGQGREERIYRWATGQLLPVTFCTSQGYRDQAACSQMWREGFPLSCCDGVGMTGYDNNSVLQAWWMWWQHQACMTPSAKA